MKAVLVGALLLQGSFAMANAFPKCAAEIKEFKCTGDDKAVYECLQKHDDKLSKDCDSNHEAYEKANGIKK